MSKQPSFTKGNWYINDCGVHWNNPDLKRLEVCYSEIGEVICDTVYTEADANLIAAAPEMYAALNRFYLSLLKVDADSGETKALEQLLAKARGES
jgi:hypothetical protein